MYYKLTAGICELDGAEVEKGELKEIEKERKLRGSNLRAQKKTKKREKTDI